MGAGGEGRGTTLGQNMKTGNLPDYMFLHINSFGFSLQSLFHELLHRLCAFIKFLLSHSTWSWAFFSKLTSKQGAIIKALVQL